MAKRYIGDSIYVDYDGWSYIVTTENGISTQNTIVFEPEYMQALFDYVEKIKKENKETRQP